MLAAQLEERFHQALGAPLGGRDDSVAFAVAFALLLARHVPPETDPGLATALRTALRARTDLTPEAIEVLLGVVLAPENRTEISEDELRAYGARFGDAQEKALRVSVANELDLGRFGERYGPVESLLLLDSLFRVCARDGRIDSAEIGRLQRAAFELQIDQKLVAALFRRYDVRHARGDFGFELKGQERVTIGRAPGCEIQLPDSQIARRHAVLTRSEDGWRITDLGSGRPTFLNGAPVRDALWTPGQDLRIGSFHLALDASGEVLTAFDGSSFAALSVRDLYRTLQGGRNRLRLLDGISFTVFSGEVVAVLGPSGAGKTTLLQAITGIAPADAGEVLLDRSDFAAMLRHDKSLVGVVPQDDVLHGELTVEETLKYAARLRYGDDVASVALQPEVDRVLAQLGLESSRDTRIGTPLARGISGGQRKRVNLGQELLTGTTRVLFLDEPTSGLDPQTSQGILTSVRQLADDGRIVFVVTHDVSPSLLTLVDHILVLAPGGRLAWFGPPDEACAYFRVPSVDAVFGLLPSKTPDEWASAFRASPAWRKYVRTREHLLGIDAMRPAGQAAKPVRVGSARTQLRTLVSRYARVKVRDRVGTGVLLAQAPVLGVAIAIVFPQPDIATMFVVVLSALWFGASASVRELISERPIWRRESRVGVRLLPYVASKLVVLGTLVSLQCLVLTAIVYAALGMGGYGYSFLALSAVSVAMGLVGTTLGLLVSSIFSSSEAAVGTLPLILIPQITFGGLIVKVKDMTVLAKAASTLMVTRWGFEAAIKAGDKLSQPAHEGLESSAQPIGRFLWELGFRTSDADDMGLPQAVLFGILGLFALVFVAVATWRTHQEREGG